MATILWLSGEYLLPADSGLYRYSLDMMNALRTYGHEINAIGRARTPEGEDRPAPGWVILPHRSLPMWRRMAGKAPVKVVDVWDRTYAAAVERAMDEHAPDVVLFDHLRAAAALDVIGGRIPTVYVSQNDESMVKRRMVPAARGIRKLALWIDLKKMERFETRVLRQCDGISAISSADVKSFASRVPHKQIVHTLPSYRGTRVQTRTITADTPRRVAMISTLYWGAKIDNMTMALRGLEPSISAGTEVVVFTGGYQPPAAVARDYPTVRFEGFVEDFDAALDECRLGVVYEPVGGGFKMKTLDFIFHRVPLVTGRASAADLPLQAGESVELVNSADELAPVVDSLLDDFDRLNSLQEAAFATCAGLFTSDAVRPLSDLVDQLTSTHSIPN